MNTAASSRNASPAAGPLSANAAEKSRNSSPAAGPPSANTAAKSRNASSAAGSSSANTAAESRIASPAAGSQSANTTASSRNAGPAAGSPNANTAASSRDARTAWQLAMPRPLGMEVRRPKRPSSARNSDGPKNSVALGDGARLSPSKGGFEHPSACPSLASTHAPG